MAGYNVRVVVFCATHVDSRVVLLRMSSPMSIDLYLTRLQYQAALICFDISGASLRFSSLSNADVEQRSRVFRLASLEQH